MRYFSKFPQVSYALQEQTASRSPILMTRTVPNMTVKLLLDILEKERTEITYYRIQDGERPDTVAVQLYGASSYAWILLLVNQMRDWYDWPLTENQFYEYINQKYESQPGANDGVTQAQNKILYYQWNILANANTSDETVTQKIILDGSLGGIDKPTFGTVTNAANSNIVIGTATNFSNVIAGDYIFIGDSTTANSQYAEITTVTNSTHLVVATTISKEFITTPYRILTNVPLNTQIGSIQQISQFQQEYDINDKKRFIKIIPVSAVSLVVEQFNLLMSS